MAADSHLGMMALSRVTLASAGLSGLISQYSVLVCKIIISILVLVLVHENTSY